MGKQIAVSCHWRLRAGDEDSAVRLFKAIKPCGWDRLTTAHLQSGAA